MQGTFSNFAAERVANSISLFYIFIVELKENRYKSQFYKYFYFVFCQDDLDLGLQQIEYIASD